MSSDRRILVDGVGKRYALGVTTGFAVRGFRGRTTTADAVAEAIRRRRHRDGERKEFWALRDVSFELQEGERLGLIGRNGAGKSTLLKIMTRITDLTEGRIDLWGRVGSLLEVGTGFHPELTGRENIYLNGSLLGMRPNEISQEFDAIVDFAGVEQFLDTPVKRFSSGMSVRLAFAIAAHLRADILLVDEVLSVGDKMFRDKCLGKLDDVSKSGRTVIYVSHLMETVTQLCSRAVLLERGRLTADGDVDDVVASYIAKQNELTNLVEGMDERPGSGVMRFVDASVGEALYASHDEKVVDFTIERRRSDYAGRFFVVARVVDQRQVVVANCDARYVDHALYSTERHRGRLRLRTPWLKPGRYRVDLSLVGPKDFLIDEAIGAAFMEVGPRHPYTGRIGRPANHPGAVFSDFSYEELPPDAPRILPAAEAPGITAPFTPATTNASNGRPTNGHRSSALSIAASPSPGNAHPPLAEEPSFDLTTGRVTFGSHSIELTSTELLLFACLVERRGQVVSQEWLAEEGWEDPEEGLRQLEATMAALAAKLAARTTSGAIEAVAGGYRFGSPA